jgi:hypothetical protein
MLLQFASDYNSVDINRTYIIEVIDMADQTYPVLSN